MNVVPVIRSEVLIRNRRILLQGALWYEGHAEEDFAAFCRNVYRKLALEYPKFFKMDNLCKLAFLCSELAWPGNDVKQQANPSRLAVVLANRASSLDTDRKFYESIADPENYFPSPSVFVYTLPNIAIGEISIRNGLTGEHAFFVFDQFDGVTIFDYVSGLLAEGRADACLLGWCEVDQGREEALFILCENSELKNDDKPLNGTTINKLYKQNEWL